MGFWNRLGFVRKNDLLEFEEHLIERIQQELSTAPTGTFGNPTENPNNPIHFNPQDPQLGLDPVSIHANIAKINDPTQLENYRNMIKTKRGVIQDLNKQTRAKERWSQLAESAVVPASEFAGDMSIDTLKNWWSEQGSTKKLAINGTMKLLVGHTIDDVISHPELIPELAEKIVPLMKQAGVSLVNKIKPKQKPVNPVETTEEVIPEAQQELVKIPDGKGGFREINPNEPYVPS